MLALLPIGLCLTIAHAAPVGSPSDEPRATETAPSGPFVEDGISFVIHDAGNPERRVLRYQIASDHNQFYFMSPALGFSHTPPTETETEPEPIVPRVRFGGNWVTRATQATHPGQFSFTLAVEEGTGSSGTKGKALRLLRALEREGPLVQAHILPNGRALSVELLLSDKIDELDHGTVEAAAQDIGTLVFPSKPLGEGAEWTASWTTTSIEGFEVQREARYVLTKLLPDGRAKIGATIKDVGVVGQIIEPGEHLDWRLSSYESTITATYLFDEGWPMPAGNHHRLTKTRKYPAKHGEVEPHGEADSTLPVWRAYVANYFPFGGSGW